MSSTAERIQSAYSLPHANNIHGEAKRLDDQHEGIQAFIGETLSFAPLEGSVPKAILELGCGSGAWAIQAAKTFPKSEVLAVDLAPIPKRPLPQNVMFQSLDLSKPFPFEPETFDIIHARFVYFHLPKLEDVLSRTIKLLRPGGWLLLDDPDKTTYDDGGLGPGQEGFWKAFQKRTGDEDTKPLGGSAYGGLIGASGSFSEVNVKKVCLPLSKPSNDLKTRKLTASLKTALLLAIQAFSENPEALDMDAEIGKQAQEEMKDPTRNLQWDFYFTWSRKRV